MASKKRAHNGIDHAPTAEKFAVYTAGTDRDLVTLGGGPCRAIRANEAGNLVVITEAGDTVTVPFLAGEMLPLCCTNTVAASSTVTNILVIW